MKHRSKVALTILCVSLVVFFLEHVGWLQNFEIAGLDKWMRVRASREVADIVIVYIDEEDYHVLFKRTSPLNSDILQRIIKAIALGRPRVIGIDLDTSDITIDFKKDVQSIPEWPHIIWGRDVFFNKEDGIFEPLPVLREKTPGVRSGLVLLPQDQDGLIRRYKRIFQTKHGIIDSFPWAVVKVWTSPAIENAEPPAEDLVLNFAGDRYSFPRISTRYVLTLSKEPGWQSQGPLRGKIVLLGGLYRAARDEYITPLGPMAGVEIMAQAIASELQGGGIRPINAFMMLVLEIVGGVVLVLLHRWLKLGWALLASLVIIPVMAVGFSFLSFLSFSRWANFVPILAAVLIHELYHHAQEYHRMSKELTERHARET